MTMSILIDMSLVMLGIFAGNVIFNNFEKHLPYWRRLLKHGTLYVVLFLIRFYGGGAWLVASLLILTAGQVVLHAWYFPKHGINGLTAEPYDDYLKLITKMKAKRHRKQ